jgi:hypothetical protein
LVGDTIVIPAYRKLTKQAYDKKNDEILKHGIEDSDLKGKPLRVLALGSWVVGLAFNNETIGYSVSNLIANQMGVEFNNPYFDSEDFNGAYTYVPTNFNPTGGPVPKFRLPVITWV